MYIPELEPYPDWEPIEGEPDPLAVGWLHPDHPGARGPTSEEFRSKLFDLCKHFVQPTRGFHNCPFCERPPLHPPEVTHHHVPGLGMQPTPEYIKALTLSMPDKVREFRDGCEQSFGSAEIRVRGADGVVYGAPDLIYHYVVAHDYLPPAAFIEAVCQWSPPEGTRDAG
ncbi:hypothetical protein [Luteolibacter sp. LG18]|uniref:DUF7919 family protein n=1 Tax=Luteolibacter sp. LG18 TaxID=2819286 RepID=UPI002B2E5487|nr:hypothetical protein llg_27220 [Luteolibacter sp. LG18]